MNRSTFLLRYFNPSWLSSRLAAVAPLPVRLIVGYGFIAHGCAKIAKNPDNFAAILHALTRGKPAAIRFLADFSPI